ncbi:MAG: SpoIIE family protein phosphatase [Actinomycetota bacterium]|nr:SpoIIE family protein phosphatase [Actinomycetota bacterium]
MERSTRRGSLAANLMVLVLMVVGVSVTIISLAALSGVFDLARSQVAARQKAYRQAAASEIEVHFDGAFRVVERAIGVISDPAAGGIDQVKLAATHETGVEYIDRLVVFATDGAILSAHPSYVAREPLPKPEILSAALSETPSLYWDKSRARLWVARRATAADGTETVVAVRARMGYLGGLLDGFASESSDRWLAVLDSDRSVIASSAIGPNVEPLSIEYEPDKENPATGAVKATSSSGAVMWGEYAELEGYRGIAWRVVTAEPRSAVAVDTMRALIPAVGALVFSVAFSLMFTGLFSRRLVAPLKDLEFHAQQAVSGAYVRSIETDRTDEIGRLADAFNAVALRLNALHDLSQLLASSSSLDQVLDGILSAMSHIVGSSSVAVYLVNDVGEALSLARTRGVQHPGDVTVPLSSSSRLADALYSSGPVPFGDPDPDIAAAFGLAADSPASGLVAPLVVGNEPLGVIAVLNTDHHVFSQAEMEMVRTFSAQAAIAVHNSRLFEEEIRSRHEAEAMREVAERLAMPGELETALGDVAKRVAVLLDAVDWSVAVVDRDLLGMEAASDAANERNILRMWGRALVGRDQRHVLRLGPGDDPLVDEYLVKQDAHFLLMATVIRGGTPGAVLAFAVRRPGALADSHETGVVEALATQIALALDNAFYFEQARTRSANIETIFRISQAVSSSLQIKVVLNRVLDVVQKIFTADTVSLMIFDEQKRVIDTAMARGLVSNDILHFSCAPGQEFPGAVFESGEPAKIDELVTTVGLLAAAAVRQGLHAALAVPLLARGRSLGVLTVFSSEPGVFTEEDRGLLHTFASQAALAIDTADMYGREHMVASVLQSSILPETLPEYPEIKSSSVYQAAGNEAEIGGDYFDLFKTPAGNIVMAIADVCGKGVVAATKTSMIKYTVRGLAATGLSPARMVAQVNRMVAEGGTPSDIVTLWLGVFDVAAGTLVYANGGHPPALFRFADGSGVERLATTGPLLGAIADASYGEQVVPVVPGDTVLLYTDGVTEARRGNRFFGEGRVRRSLRYGGTPDDIAKRLLAALSRFAPGQLRDDAAILAVTFGPLPGDIAAGDPLAANE